MKRRIISNLVTTICTAVVATTVLSGCDSAQLSLNSNDNADATKEDTENNIEEDAETTSEAKSDEEFEDISFYDSEELMEGEELSEDDLSQIQDFLNQSESNGFVKSSYRTPDKIDWMQVFYNGAGLKNCDYPQEALDEYLSIIKKDSVEYDLLALSGEDVRALVEAKTGITDFELSKTGYTYIEEYDVLFDQVSDTNYVKAICEKGVRNGELIQVSVYGETDRIGRVGSYRRITLVETGDSENPYHFYSNRELWEKYVDDTMEASDYETDEKITCAYISGEFGPESVVIDDNAVSRIVYLRIKDHDMTDFDDFKEIVFCDVNGDGCKDMIIIASDGKETIAVVCSSYEDRSGNICLDGGDDSVTSWLVENVDDMTADNVISYILDHQDEFEAL